jgi:hypothetical protein
MIDTIDIEKSLFTCGWEFRESTFEVYPAENMWEFFMEFKKEKILIDVTLGGQGRYLGWFALIEKPEISFLISNNVGVAELEDMDTDCVKCIFWVPTSEIVILNVYSPIDNQGWKTWYVGYLYWSVVKFCQNNAERFGITLDFFKNEAFSSAYIDNDHILRIYTER